MKYEILTEEECKQIVAAIEQAELDCSGEIRVHVDGHCKDNVLDSASMTFAKLGMHRTKLRNGVLFYLAALDKKFAVIGDVGINSKVGKHFWDDVVSAMTVKFKEGLFAEGLCDGILRCGEQLKTYFPYQSDDVNELDDEVSFGEDAKVKQSSCGEQPNEVTFG